MNVKDVSLFIYIKSGKKMIGKPVPLVKLFLHLIVNLDKTYLKENDQAVDLGNEHDFELR